jgi:hypothetical protein
MRHHVRMDAYSEDLTKKKRRRSSRPSRGVCPRRRQLASSAWGSPRSSVTLPRPERVGLSPRRSAPRLQAQDGSDHQEALGGQPLGASGGYAAPKARRVPRAGGWCAGERLYDLADAQAAWVEPKKDAWELRKRDELLRAAWRLLVAGEINAQRLVFSWTNAPREHLAQPAIRLVPKGRERAYGEAPRNYWGSKSPFWQA